PRVVSIVLFGGRGWLSTRCTPFRSLPISFFSHPTQLKRRLPSPQATLPPRKRCAHLAHTCLFCRDKAREKPALAAEGKPRHVHVSSCSSCFVPLKDFSEAATATQLPENTIRLYPTQSSVDVPNIF
ncbi:unnamed protein product, partial [Ectocarpus sp. 12 AP-2014]